MKKIILAIALFVAVSANAQSDGFFSYNTIDSNRGGSSEWGAIPTLPSTHGLDFDQNANAIDINRLAAFQIFNKIVGNIHR